MIRKLAKIRHVKLYLFILLLILVGTGTYAWYHTEHSPKKIVTAGTPVSYPLRESSQPLKKIATSNNSAGSSAGGASDSRGTQVPSTKSSQWTSSASGLITVKSPAPNSTLKNGDVIGGSAKIDSVQYRLIDNKIGVIGQGSLSVVNGNFSGVLHFSPQGTGGQLDVFSTDAQGVEYNEIQINVGF